MRRDGRVVPDIHFVYAPRSGPRWLPGAGPREGIVVPTVVWQNQSAHVYGYRVSVRASIPGRYWRDEAREAARAVALYFGGLAYDNQGEVSVVVRENIEARYAAAWFLMLHPRSAPGLWPDRELLGVLDAGMYAEELGLIVQALSDTIPAFAAFVRINGRPVYPTDGPWWDAEVGEDADKLCVRVLDHYNNELARIAAPSVWGRPTVYGVADVREIAEGVPV
jgi:hypothetical protein